MCTTDAFSALTLLGLGSRKGTRPVKKPNGGVLARLSAWSEVQTWIWPMSLASVKSTLVYLFWYQLSLVVPDRELLNGWLCNYVNNNGSLYVYSNAYSNAKEVCSSTTIEKHKSNNSVSVQCRQAKLSTALLATNVCRQHIKLMILKFIMSTFYSHNYSTSEEIRLKNQSMTTHKCQGWLYWSYQLSL